MNRANVVRAVLAFAVLATSFYFAYTKPARLGLDLRGGTQIVLETQDSPTVKADRESTDRALEVLRRRVDALGVAEPTLTRSGDRRIIVELPGVQDPPEAPRSIGRTAQLSFHPVLAPTPASPTSAEGPAAHARRERAADPHRARRAHRRRRRRAPTPSYDPQNGSAGGSSTSTSRAGRQDLGGADRQGRLRRRRRRGAGRDRAGRQGHLLAAGDPSVPCGVGITGGSTQITGDFSAEEAKDLAALIKGGALPGARRRSIEQRTVGPTLGEEAIEASAKAAVIGIVLTGAVHHRRSTGSSASSRRSRWPATR